MSEETSAISCRQVWDEMNDLLTAKETKLVRNFCCRIDMSDYIVETKLFPIEALKVYSSYNLGDSIREEDRSKYFSAHRGGSQGDYRDGIKGKIKNVVDCLQTFPASKRAVITIPNNPSPLHSSDDDAKCMREIHFYINDDCDDDDHNHRTLNATVWMRAQAAEIFPKNIHFVGSLMEVVAQRLCQGNLNNEDGKALKLGELFYLATTLVSVRDD